MKDENRYFRTLLFFWTHPGKMSICLVTMYSLTEALYLFSNHTISPFLIFFDLGVDDRISDWDVDCTCVHTVQSVVTAIWKWSDVWSSMVTHTQNLCSAFCGAREAVGVLVLYSRVSPQSWYLGGKNTGYSLTMTIPASDLNPPLFTTSIQFRLLAKF